MTQNRCLHCVCMTQMHLRTGSCTTWVLYGIQANKFIPEQILALRVYYTAYKQTDSFQNTCFFITRYTRKQIHFRTDPCNRCVVYSTQGNRFIPEQNLALSVCYTVFKQTASSRFLLITAERSLSSLALQTFGAS